MDTQTIILFAVAGLIGYLLLKSRRSSQLAFIQNYRFHPLLGKKIKEKYPHLSDRDTKLVLDALRDYFHICNLAGKRMVAMPSQVVDLAWHEFILSTRSYKDFSQKAIGRFLHHTPTEAMKTPTLAQEGIKRVWHFACKKDGIDPKAPTRLPLLFAIDALLGIEDGYRYSLDCRDRSSPNYGSGYCAGDIGCASGCGGDSGGLDSSCGSGCGGD